MCLRARQAAPWAFAALAISVVSLSCAELSVKTGPGTSFPCGVGGNECRDGMCCPPGNICGGDDRRCPPGQCCFEGEDGVVRQGAAAKSP
jgi:hypothetical protein